MVFCFILNSGIYSTTTCLYIQITIFEHCQIKQFSICADKVNHLRYDYRFCKSFSWFVLTYLDYFLPSQNVRYFWILFTSDLWLWFSFLRLDCHLITSRKIEKMCHFTLKLLVGAGRWCCLRSTYSYLETVGKNMINSK